MRFRGALHFLVRTLSTGGTDFARSVFADGYVFTANVGQGLNAYHCRNAVPERAVAPR